MIVSEQLTHLDDAFIKELNDLASNKVEYWDLRAQISTGVNIDFTDKKSKEISSFQSSTCGVRTFKNGGYGFMTLKDLSKKSIRAGLLDAIKLARFSESLTDVHFTLKEIDPVENKFQITCKKDLLDTSMEEKVNFVKEHEKIASEYAPSIKNTRTFYLDVNKQSIFMNSRGSHVSQDISLLRLFNLVFSQKKGVIQRAVNSIGGLGGMEIVETDKAQELSLKSAQEAVELLEAKSPVGGKFTIIMDPKLTGTFIHEAFGHASEGDEVLSKQSLLEGCIGEKVALDSVNIYDDPRMGQGKKLGLPYELYGSYFVDDEGIPAQKTTIIENGVLKNYLHSIETASRMNLNPNGHGRAASATSRPIVRMGITVLEPGDFSLDEMIEDTKSGILCEDFKYGYTDPSTGNFTFSTKLSYRIENGEKKELMRDVALSGMTLEVLNRISALGKEISFSDGMCGKGGQSVRVCDGGPYTRIEDILVGGLG